MNKPVANFNHDLPAAQLLRDDEVILLVDDDRMIRESIAEFLRENGLPVIEADSAAALRQRLGEFNVALVLLDIGLPDQPGSTLIPELMAAEPDLAIIMLSGVADIQVAIDCIRSGAEDYLAKPVKFNEILVVMRQALTKRRLVYDNRKYQEDLEQANFRFQLLHQLSLKINSVYLTTTELDKVLHAILVGITANEGLRFNRAFLALFDEAQEYLQGRLAIGPSCRDEAAHIWAEMQQKEISFFDMLGGLHDCAAHDNTLNNIVERLHVPVSNDQHILIRSAMERRSFLVGNGQAAVPVDQDLLELLGQGTFVIVPLFSPRAALGVIVADNYVTGNPISDNDLSMLELFASQVSLAIEHSKLHSEMQHKIVELEQLNHELDKNKDLLVEAERYSALGQMAAQMVHVLRNPITSIGGVCRILLKKVSDPEWKRYLDVVVSETARLESTLGELFDFVSLAEPDKSVKSLYPLIRKTVLLVQPTMLKHNITWQVDLDDSREVLVNMDSRQIRQMFLHIIRNALEAMEQGGQLQVTAEVVDGWVVVRISDTGLGLSDASLTRARDPFFTTKTYGSGMGLAMVDRIVESHGGTFMLSRKQEGMEAVVELPLAG
ncbi:MAG: two-component system sensor histidine kinase/response regulator [Desulfobulbaceae bacterium]|nr:MAG: two-component system sensor histidine kinase/response regulator [Desulfobulbaceae bacterium]